MIGDVVMAALLGLGLVLCLMGWIILIKCMLKCFWWMWCEVFALIDQPICKLVNGDN